MKNNLVAENRKITGNRFDGFFYDGEFITDLDPGQYKQAIKASLHSSLVPAMDAIAKAEKELKNDTVWVKQTLTLLLAPCQSIQDVRDALPNQLAETVEGCRGLSRLRPDGFTLASDPRKYKQYLALKEKIEFYSVTKLLY